MEANCWKTLQSLVANSSQTPVHVSRCKNIPTQEKSQVQMYAQVTVHKYYVQ